jgi:hypothetical protein
VRFVIDGAVSMRAASRVVGVLNEIRGEGPHLEPAHTTVQNFILRIGLYLLQQSQTWAEDWIWIVDHTIAMGTLKCFVVLGIRKSDYQRLNRPLTHHDLVPLALIPVEQSNGEIVRGQFQQMAAVCGAPLAILSDRGSDLKKGVELLQQEHPEVVALDDIVHLASRLIEKILKEHDRWEAYRKASCQCANAVRQSKLAHLKPPRPKTKARYMNIDREVRWGVRALHVLDRVRSGNLNERQQERLPLDVVEQRFRWLDNYREELELWQELSSIGHRSCRVIRRHGYGRETIEALQLELGTAKHSSSRDLSDKIIRQVEPLCEAATVHGNLPGSSEVIESLIGKGKRLLGFSSGNSLTRQVLAMATSTAKLTPKLVRDALSSCRMKHLHDWCKENLIPSIQQQRREDLIPSPEEQNLRNPTTAPIPSF